MDNDTDITNAALGSGIQIEELVNTMLASGLGQGSFEFMSNELDNVSWVDFTEISYVLEPETTSLASIPSKPNLSLTEVDLLIGLLENGVDTRDYEWFYGELKFAVHRAVWNVVLSKLRVGSQGATISLDPIYDTGVINFKAVYSVFEEEYKEEEYKIDVNVITNRIMSLLPWTYAADLADTYYSVQYLSSSDTYFAQSAIFQRVEAFFSRQDSTNPWAGDTYLYLAGVSQLGGKLVQNRPWLETAWTEVRNLIISEFGEGQEEISELLDEYAFKPKPPPSQHPFMTFIPGSINLGLRLVYRQEWRYLGNQRGEVIRTIPLGPKQVERVSTKVVRRTQTTKTSEELRSTV